MVYNGREQARTDFVTNKQVWGFNGVASLAASPLFAVSREQSVVVNMTNRTNFMHAMHARGHHFRVLDRMGNESGENALRDTMLIEPEGKARLALVVDNPGRWLLHCHMLEHAAAGMNT